MEPRGRAAPIAPRRVGVAGPARVSHGNGARLRPRPASGRARASDDMARPSSNTPRSPARRALRMAGMNAAIFATALVAVWLGYRLLHNPRDAGPGVPTPSVMSVGDAPGPLLSGDYRLELDGARWIAQDSLPKDLPLSFRARPSALVDYLVLRVTVSNEGAAAVPFSFLDSGQNVRLLVVSYDPHTVYVDALDPREAALISGETPLASGALAAGSSRSGVVVYALERYRKGLRLLLVPSYPTGEAPADGPQHPAIEMRFTP